MSNFHYISLLFKSESFLEILSIFVLRFPKNFGRNSGFKDSYVKYEYSFRDLEGQPQNEYSTSL